MLHRFSIARSPRTLLLPLLVVVLVGGSIAFLVFVEPIVGVIALAIAALVSYYLVKYFVNTIRSSVLTTDDGMVCRTSMGGETSLTWSELSHAGWFVLPNGRRDLFVYAESSDKLLSMPDHYEAIDEIAATVSQHVDLITIDADDGDELADRLRELLYPEDEIQDD